LGGDTSSLSSIPPSWVGRPVEVVQLSGDWCPALRTDAPQVARNGSKNDSTLFDNPAFAGAGGFGDGHDFFEHLSLLFE